MLDDIILNSGYKVTHVYSGEEALLFWAKNTPDLILINIDILENYTEEFLIKVSEIPMIVLMSKNKVKENIRQLLNDEVEYAEKPLIIEKLMIKIIKILEKNEPVIIPNIITYDDIRLNRQAYDVCIGDEHIRLTKTEFEILKFFMENSDEVIEKHNLLDSIKEYTPDCMESSLRMHISNLRKKLRAVSGKDYIESVWGVGFKLTDV